MRMFLRGEWVDRSDKIEVLNPYDNSVVDTVPRASVDDVQAALAGAVQGAVVMRGLPGYERCQILRRAAEIMRRRHEDLARTISQEEGKILAESRLETARAIETIELSAEEAKRTALPAAVESSGSRSASRAAWWLRLRPSISR